MSVNPYPRGSFLKILHDSDDTNLTTEQSELFDDMLDTIKVLKIGLVGSEAKLKQVEEEVIEDKPYLEAAGKNAAYIVELEMEIVKLKTERKETRALIHYLQDKAERNEHDAQLYRDEYKEDK